MTQSTHSTPLEIGFAVILQQVQTSTWIVQDSWQTGLAHVSHSSRHSKQRGARHVEQFVTQRVQHARGHAEQVSEVSSSQMEQASSMSVGGKFER